MGIDDRDYSRERTRKRLEEEDGAESNWPKAHIPIKSTTSPNPRANVRIGRSNRTHAQWLAKVLVWLVIALVLFTVFKKFDARRDHRAEFASASTVFPPTGEVRWFIAVTFEPGGVAPLSITGSHEPGKNVIVRLDNWDTRAPVAMIPIRGGETANLQVPLGRYRLMYSSNAAWHEEAKIFGDVQEAVDPLEFYRTDVQVIGHAVDLNSRLNGNMKTKQSGFF